ncbi:GNAT family N-acetyltransferase [Vibrio vulnificus]|uniref:GNAT family N-acetyltransferase n=1 Tax=Vibrio vulnificus TaxID=672 RepID=UPI000A9A2EBE|nr:GNAT family N-acetyltransferase [Vibrio vulnificus]MCU8302388.1 GNAT family N-acetyltransferase [Vibrio vulnificus]MCU8332849.1 GNAT family N-acetyltransferase [Vibrio vulnificus]MCU8402555.1 GNAT family N-acetyltransferase [Vibrio vulnificus]MCU8409515.1 GNAT family N-acetyltransferase [Vibrio vulnificus]MCU8524462.1 GNAT family N-acetyltransferase [Vibrio vulnificus]
MRSSVTNVEQGRFHLRMLSSSDDASLLVFEYENRHWFERFITPRDASMFSEQGIRKHIDYCLSEYQHKRMLPMIVESDEGAIVGRVNFHDIKFNRGVATLGYRFSEESAGKGIATQMVTKSMVVLENLGFRSVLAVVASDNFASQRVLEKCGFRQMNLIANYVILHGQSVDCFRYLYQFKVKK